jgi:sulfonate transport system substrate-binding protein
MNGAFTLNRRTVLGTGLALLVAGCGGRGRAGGRADTVRISSIGYIEGGALQVGGNQTAAVYERGLLEDALAGRGIGLQWVPISSALGGPGFNEALASRATDFAAYGDFPAIIARAGGIPIKLVVPAGRGTNSYLIVPAGSPARNIADLKGKSIAIQRGRPPELAFSKLIDSGGLSHSDFRIFNVNAAASAAAVAAGEVDGAFVGPDAYLLEDRQVARIIWSSKGTDLKWRSELFVHDDFARDNAELVQEVVDAYVAAARWASDDLNREEAQRLISRSGTPLSVVQRDAEGDIPWRERFSPLFDDYMHAHYEEAITFAHDEELIRNRFAVDEFFEPHYVDEALRTLGLEDYWTKREARTA